MKITMIGTGYVGLVTGACLAEVGNDVLCLDVDARKIDVLQRGGIPIHEPGLEDMVAAQRRRRPPAASPPTSTAQRRRTATLQFIAVGTPPDEDGSRRPAVRAGGRAQHRPAHGRATRSSSTSRPCRSAPPTACATRSREELAARGVDMPFAVVSNPEFLKEGAAVDDFMQPDRIVIGADDDARDRASCAPLYAPFQRNHERAAGDGRALGRAHQVRGQRDARDAHLVHERAREPRRAARRRHRSTCARASAPIRASATTSSTRASATAARCFPKDVQALQRTARAARRGHCSVLARGRSGQRRAEAACSVDKIVARFGDDLAGTTLRVVGPRVQAEHRRHARGAVARDHRRAARARRDASRAYDPVAMDEAQARARPT